LIQEIDPPLERHDNAAKLRQGLERMEYMQRRLRAPRAAGEAHVRIVLADGLGHVIESTRTCDKVTEVMTVIK
jgi:hypothetical protein